MTPDTIYTTLVNAGFVVAVVGQMFLVSLTNRTIAVSEVERVLGYTRAVSYAKSDDGVYVCC